MTEPLVVHGMLGLGDNFYQRAVVREVAKTREVYLETAWPELFADLPVTPLRPSTHLRTQAKNIARRRAWGRTPANAHHLSVSYAGRPGSMLEALCANFGIAPLAIDFSGPPVVPARRPRPYIVVRPATVRQEWRADSRNPLPEYLARAAAGLRMLGYHVISIADLQPGVEWAVEPLPPADETWHAGELHIEDLLSLVAGAAGVIGGVGWMVPAAIAYRVPMLLLFGGWGRDNGPTRIFDRRLDTSLIEQAVPDAFCLCTDRFHACDRRISNLDESIERFTDRVIQREHAPLVA